MTEDTMYDRRHGDDGDGVQPDDETDDPRCGARGEGKPRDASSSSLTLPSQATVREWSSTGDRSPVPGGDPSPSSSSGDRGRGDAAGGDTDTSDARGGVVPRCGSSTVYVDLSSGVYHAREAHAGPEPAAFTRGQAEQFSYRACPDCF